MRMDRIWAEKWEEKFQQEGTSKPRFQMQKRIYLWFSALRINGPSLERGQNLHLDRRNLVLILETMGSDGRWLFWWWVFVFVFVFEQKKMIKAKLQRLDLGTARHVQERKGGTQSRWKLTSSRSEPRRTELAGCNIEKKKADRRGIAKENDQDLVNGHI